MTAKKSDVLRWVNREIALAADKGVHVHASFIRIKKDGLVRFEREFVNAAGVGGNEFIDNVKKVFGKVRSVDEGECGDVFRGKASHFVEIKLNEKDIPESIVPAEVKSRRDLYNALRTTLRLAVSLSREVKEGGPVYSVHVAEFLKATSEAGAKLKSTGQHHNAPAKKEKKEKVKAE